MNKFIGALALLFAGSLYAAPSIESVSSTVEDGVPKTTIIGTGFSDANLKIALKDGAGSQTMFKNGTLIPDLAGNYWDKQGSPWAEPLVPTEVDGEMVYRGKGKTYNGWPKMLEGMNLQTLYVSWQYNPSEKPSHSGGSNKHIRIWDNHSGEDTRISWTIMHLTYEGGSASWEGFSGKANFWNQMEIWVDAPNNNIKAWINNDKRHDVNDFAKVDNGIGLSIGLIGFDPSSSSPYVDKITLIDDIYISNTRARVVVSDAATWAEASLNGDIQVPVKWEDGQVTFYNQGEGKFLYVVDQDGNANEEGFLLAAPVEVEGCVKCPMPVGNFQFSVNK